MNDDWPDGRPRKLAFEYAGTEAVERERTPLDRFLDAASDIEFYLTAEALQALGDGTWRERYEWHRDLTNDHHILVHVSPTIVMTVGIVRHFPNYFYIPKISAV